MAIIIYAKNTQIKEVRLHSNIKINLEVYKTEAIIWIKVTKIHEINSKL